MATIIDKGNYVEIDRGESPDTKRFVVKPFSVVVCLPNNIELRDSLGNKWSVDSTTLTGFTFTDIYDLKEQVMLLNNSYQVDATVTIDPSGLATSDNQTNGNQKTQIVDSGGDVVTVTGGKLDVNASIDTTGLATEFKQDAQIFQLGSLTETPPASDTASSGINGRLQRIAQRLSTSILELLNISSALNVINTSINTLLKKTDFEARINTLGQKTSANSTPVVLPSDQIVSTTSLDGTSTTQNTTTVASSATSILLLLANPSRRQVTITNEANKKMWICFFSPATTSTPFVLERGESWIFPKWKGDIYGIWDTSPTGSAYVTEELV